MLVFQGKQLEKSKNLSKIASMVAETIYSMSPKILNETINKDKPTGSGRLALRNYFTLLFSILLMKLMVIHITMKTQILVR